MSKQKIIPLGKRVLVKPLPIEKETDSGILLAPSQIELIPRGHIVAIGSAVEEDIKVGDFVEFVGQQKEHRTYIHEGEPCFMMHDHLIACKIEDV